MTSRYELLPEAADVVAVAIKLLRKIIASDLPKPAQLPVIAEVLNVIARMPHTFPPLDAAVTLIGPTRIYGEHEIHHFWSVEVSGQDVYIKAAGHFYRKSTGGDSFTSLSFFAAPDSEATVDDMWHRHRIVDDAAPFAEQIDGMDLTEPGYRLSVDRDGDAVHSDDGADDESDDGG